MVRVAGPFEVLPKVTEIESLRDVARNKRQHEIGILASSGHDWPGRCVLSSDTANVCSTWMLAFKADKRRGGANHTSQSDCLNTYLKESSCEPVDSDCICADQKVMDNVAACTLTNCTVIEGLGRLQTSSLAHLRTPIYR